MAWSSWSLNQTKIMASGPITSRQIDGKTEGTVADFILGGSKIPGTGESGGCHLWGQAELDMTEVT